MASASLPAGPGRGVLGIRRRLAGGALAGVGLWLITWANAPEIGVLGTRLADAPQVAPEALTAPLLLYLALTAVVAGVGGAVPGLACALAGVALGNVVFTNPRGTFSVVAGHDVVALAVFLLIAAMISVLTDLATRRAVQAARAQAEVRALTALAAAIPDARDPVGRVLEDVRDLFALDGVALVRRTAADGWVVEAQVGRPAVDPDGADDAVVVDGDRLLLLTGHRWVAEDRRLLAAVIAQLAVAATTRSLAETTDRLREATAAGELRAALLSAVSHDLRTPLAGIKAAGSSLVARDVVLDDALVREFGAAVVADADRLDRLITNLLDMSRLQAGATDPVAGPVALGDVLPHALHGLPARAIELRVPPELPEVQADAGLLERVLANLVENAVAHSNGALVTVWASRVPEGLAVRVIDHGPGIPPGDVEAVFQPFQRLGDAPRGRGVGLGLAIARGFTDAMGGRLRVQATPGGGTTMVLTLPVAERADRPAVDRGSAGRG